MVQIENLPHQNGPEEIPEWVKDTVDNYEDFRRLCEVHCGNNEYMTNAMKNARRIWKNSAAELRSREKEELREQEYQERLQQQQQ